MDQRLLECFTNLSKAIEELALAMENSKNSKEPTGSSIEESLKSLDINKQLKSINDGVKNISAQNQEIIKNQKSILTAVSKSEPKKSSEFEQMSRAFDKNQAANVKDGVKMILLIAGGILAVGLAFKIIGAVDLKSVIAISVSLPLIAFAFEKIAKVETSIGDLVKANIGLVIMAATIAVVSRIFQFVKPIGAAQLITVVLIAGAFAALSLSLGKLSAGMKEVDPKQAWKLPIVLIAASVAIAVSSYVLQYVRPVGFLQLVTIVFIAAAFAVISFGIAKIASAIKEIKDPVATSILMPLVLVAMSAAIAGSSYLLSQVTPIKFSQALTSIAIAAIFTIVSFGLPKITEALSKVSLAGAVLLPLVLVAVSWAIAKSSEILSTVTTIPFGTLFNIALQAISLTVIGLAFGALIYVFDKLKITVASAVQGGLSLIIIAGALAVSSQLIALGNYSKYPDLSWSLGVGLSMLAFGINVMAIGAIVSLTGGLGFGALLLGAASVLVVAASIAATSEIISKGTYTGGPSFEWAAGTGILLTAFGASMLLLGAFVGGTLGAGYLALMVGGAAIKLVAQSIVDSSIILTKGIYRGGPSESWAKGVGESIAAFAPVYASLSGMGLLKLFTGGGPSAIDMANAIRTISQGIVDAAIFFNNNNVAFEGGPSEEWSSGVGGAIAAFAPVIDKLNSGGIFGLFTGGLNVEDMNKAITGIATAIVTSSSIFKDGVYTGYPTKEWSEGVSSAISTFIPLIDRLGKGGIFGIFTGGLNNNDLYYAVTGIALAIRDSSIFLSQGNYTTIPNDFIKNLSSNVQEVVNITQALQGINTSNAFLGLRIGSSSISRMANDYQNLAKSISNLSNSIRTLDVERLTALKTFTGSIVLMSLMDSGQFEDMMDKLEDKAKVFVDVVNELGTATSGTEIKIAASSQQQGPNIGDVLTMMGRIDQRLSQISSYNSKISTYVDELRAGGSKGLKSKK